MFEQSHAVEALVSSIGQRIAEAQTQEQRNQTAKSVLESEALNNALDHVSSERIQDKMQNVRKNAAVLDHVHISPEAQDLYSRHINADNAPTEKVHGRKQAADPQTTQVTPDPTIT